jgi:anti-sigma B factor antagonist
VSDDAPEAFSIHESTGDGRVVVSLRGELDVVAAAEVNEALRRGLATGQQVVVDLGAVTFIDSTGLAAIVKSAENDEQRAQLVLRPSLHQQPQRLLTLTSVSELFAFETGS